MPCIFANRVVVKTAIRACLVRRILEVMLKEAQQFQRLLALSGYRRSTGRQERVCVHTPAMVPCSYEDALLVIDCLKAPQRALDRARIEPTGKNHHRHLRFLEFPNYSRDAHIIPGTCKAGNL